MWLGNFAAWMNGLIFLPRSWRWAYLSRAGWDASKWLVGFAALVSERGFFFQLAWGQAYPPAGWDVSVWLGNFAARMNRLISLPRSRLWAYLPLAGWNASMQLVYFATQKASVILISRWPL